LVFASHQDDLLFELCDSAIWMDEGQMKMRGSLREVITAYKGRDPFQHMDEETLTRLGLSPAMSNGEA
jgi:homopolymeric O-antigen transport system ATP-binding protein